MIDTDTGALMLAAMEAEGIAQVPIPGCTCGNTAHVVVATVDRHGIPVESRLCTACGTVRLEWQPAAGWLYTSGWYRRLHTQRGDETDRFLWQEDQWSALRALLPEHALDAPRETRMGYENTLCEIGSDTGGFLAAARDAGWTVVGLEAGGCPDSAGVYVSIHALEHMTSPVEDLADLVDLSPIRSVYYCVVPDLLATHVGEDARGDLSRWWTIAHPWNWTASTVLPMFFRAGWQVDSVQSVEPGTLATVGSLLITARRAPSASTVADYIKRHATVEGT